LPKPEAAADDFEPHGRTIGCDGRVDQGGRQRQVDASQGRRDQEFQTPIARHGVERRSRRAGPKERLTGILRGVLDRPQTHQFEGIFVEPAKAAPPEQSQVLPMRLDARAILIEHAPGIAQNLRALLVKIEIWPITDAQPVRQFGPRNPFAAEPSLPKQGRAQADHRNTRWIGLRTEGPGHGQRQGREHALDRKLLLCLRHPCLRPRVIASTSLSSSLVSWGERVTRLRDIGRCYRAASVR